MNQWQLPGVLTGMVPTAHAVPETGLVYNRMDVPDSHTILSPGEMLGNYRIDSFLGQGGFGITYIARDTMLDIQVAIKEYLPESIAKRVVSSEVQPRTDKGGEVFQRGLENFLKEARTLARFDHPNIVRVRSVFELNGTAYMVMEYERGYDLRVLFNRRDQISEPVLKAVVGPVLDGLEEVHRHGFIHRDIKPANVLVRENGTPVLLDFGSARLAVGHTSEVFTATVSAGFAPMEQYSGLDDQQGPWTDIYALGAVLYSAVTGSAPPDSAIRGSAILNGRPDPYQALLTIAPTGYSHAFCDAVDWALQFKVSARPQSLAQWRSRLFHDDTRAEPVQAVTQRGDRLSTLPEADSAESPVHVAAGAQRRPGYDEPTVVKRPPTKQGPVSDDRLQWRDDTYELTGTELFDFDGQTAIRQDRTRSLFGFGLRAIEQPKRLVAGVTALVLVVVTGGLAYIRPVHSPVNQAPLELTQRSQASRTIPSEQKSTSSEPAGDLQRPDVMSPPAELAEFSEPADKPLEPDSPDQAALEAEKAETQRAAEARAAARQEADRAIQREEARRQAQLQQELEARAAADREKKIASTREAERQAAAAPDAEAVQRSSRQALVKPVITSADMSDVLSRFDALSRAIEQRDFAAVKEITVPSERKSAYFDYVFRTFDKVEASIRNVSVSRQDQTIRGRLSINRMVRSNGDVVFPPDEFKSIPIYSIREKSWSAIHW